VLEPYDETVMLREVGLFADWFLPQAVGLNKARSLKEEYMVLWRDILAQAGLRQHVPVLRDYHADNLMWLPERNGLQRVGLLDYQDALLGDTAYDLVSFLEDARRDVSSAVIEKVLDYFIAATQQVS